jgi:phosphoserine phosphatase
VRRLVFIESSCLLDTWSMAKELVAAIARDSGTDRSRELRVLDARGTDPAALHRALWGLVAGYRCRPRAGCIDRIDALGRTASRVLHGHRRAGDTVVVVSDLIPVFGPLLKEHLQVQRVVCGTPQLDGDDRLVDGFTDVLLGAAAARAAELVARAESVAPVDCIAYGRHPRDLGLLDAVGHAVHIDYEGHLHPQSRRTPPGRRGHRLGRDVRPLRGGPGGLPAAHAARAGPEGWRAASALRSRA